MESDDDDELNVRFAPYPSTTVPEAVEETDNTNYLAVHHAARMARENPNYVERAVRKTRPPKLKLTSKLLLAPHGLALLAKQARQIRLQRKQGSEGIQLTRLIQMYDAWAKQLCPGYELDQFYSKVEKMGHERLVREQTEALIAGRHVDHLDTLKPHTTHTEAIIQQHKEGVYNKRAERDDSDLDIELEIEESETQHKSASNTNAKAHVAPAKKVEIDMPEGDFDEPEGLDDVVFGQYEDD